MVGLAPMRLFQLVFAYFLVIVSCAVSAQSSHATFSPGYPRLKYRDGTSAFKLFAALDREGVVYFVVVARVDPNINTTIPTPDEIFAGNASVRAGEIAAAAGSLMFTDPDTERTLNVRDLPDESTLDVYFATQTAKSNASGTSVASSTSEMIMHTKLLKIGDVTPPLFVKGTPRAAGHGPKSLSVWIAASEQNSTYHVIILPSSASPPRTALEVYDGVINENSANAAIVFKGSGSAIFFNTTSVTFFGDMAPGEAYTIYLTLADRLGNVNPVVQTVQMFTKCCMQCPAHMVLAGGTTCDCVVPVIFTLRVLMTENDMVRNRDELKASVAEQLSVAVSQVTMLSSEPALKYPGFMAVTMSVLPSSSRDNSTTAAVVSALTSGNLTIGGSPFGVSDLLLSGEPDTRILPGSRNRPKGRTSPMTDNGSVPGQLMEEPERTNRATFQWKVWFGDTECTGCFSQCKLDSGVWSICSSPKVYYALPQGEHNFFVRGLGSDGVPDSTPARYTWTIRYRTEVFFDAAEMTPASVNRSVVTFALSSNKPGAMFEYSFNSHDIFPTYEALPFGVTAVKVNSSVGENIFTARATAEGETSTTVARHTWVYDVYEPYTTVTTSAVKNGSMVNKQTDLRFLVYGNDTDPNALPSAGIKEIWVRFMRFNDSSTFPPPLFDWRLAENFLEVQAEFSLDSNISDLSDGLYVLSSRAVDKAGNLRHTTDPHGYDHYFFELSDKVPGTPVISPATTFEDVMTPVNNTETGERQLQITSTVPSAEAYAYRFTDIRNGQLFWPDGITEIFDGEYVLAASVNYGLRFLPSKDLHNETVLPDGSNPEFSFTVRSAGAFDDRTLVDTPITAHITVISANDSPRLDPDTDYHLTGMYIFDAANPVTNQGSSVFEIVRKGFFDVDEPETATRSNMGMVIVSADDSRGDWHWSSNAGGEWHDFPKDLSPTRPLLVRAGVEDRLRYFPRIETGIPLDDVAWTASLSFRAWDGSSGHVTGSRGQWFASNGYPLYTTQYPAAGHSGAYHTCPPSPSPSGQRLSINNSWPPPLSNSTHFPARFIYYDATSFDAGGHHSMVIASAYIEIYGIKYTAYARANQRDTELERLRQKVSLQPFCPPEYGSALCLPVHDVNASVLMRVDLNASHLVTNPPWTVEAWVRRDAVTNEQTLFSDPMSGAAIVIGLAPGTGVTGVMLPYQVQARQLARRSFYSAANNTAVNVAAANIAAIEASCARWNYSLPIKKWTHLAFVAVPEGEPYRPPFASMKLYVDGLHLGTIGPQVGMPMPLGAIGSPGRAAFTIDEVKYWSFARNPTDVFREKGLFKVGDEAGLTSYLKFEEGCGNTTYDQTTLAFVQGRHVWDINVANATWERRISGMLHCAEIFAISPSHIHPNERITMTIYGSGFKKPASVSKLHRIDRDGPTYYRVRKKPVCRFGYSGTSNRLRIVPATVVSSEVVKCTLLPEIDSMLGSIHVEFCDMGLSCCSSPVYIYVRRQDLQPPNHTQPNIYDKEINAVDDVQIMYRNAKATSVWPLNFESRTGTTITIKGQGFTPTIDGSILGPTLHDNGVYCNFTTSLIDATSLSFFRNESGAMEESQFIAKSIDYVQSASDFAVRSWYLGSNSRANLNTFKIGLDPNRSMGWFTIPAHIVSGAVAICETPVLPSASTPSGYTNIHVSLVFNNGASHVNLVPQLGWPIRALYPCHLCVTRLATDCTFPDGVLAATRNGGTMIKISTVLTDPAANPSCQFGAVKVLGRYVGSHLVECIIPLWSGHFDPHVVEFRFTMFAGGARHDPVYTRAGGPAVTISRPRHATMIAFASPTLASVAGRHRMSTLRDIIEEQVHALRFFCHLDFIKVSCVFGDFVDWRVLVPCCDTPRFVSSMASSLIHYGPSSTFFAAGFFDIMLNIAPNVENRMDLSEARPIIMFRTDPAVHALGTDSGSTDGGWIIVVIGEGFLPGDECILSSSGRVTRGSRTAGFFISSTMLLCEAPELIISRQAQSSAATSYNDVTHDSADVVFSVDERPLNYQTLGVHLGVCGGRDGQTMVHGGGIRATAMVSRPISDLDIIHPAYLPASGGLTLHLMGQNLFTHLLSFNRGRCRIGSFDMVTRPASSSTAPEDVAVQCVTPALLPTITAHKFGLHVHVSQMYPSGLIGSNVTSHPALFAPTISGIVGMPVGLPAPQEGAVGAILEIFSALTSPGGKSPSSATTGSTPYSSNLTSMLVCIVPDHDRSATVDIPRSIHATWQHVHASSEPNSDGTSPLSRCSLPRAHINIKAGFSSISVGMINSDYNAVLLSVEFEYAFSPELSSLITQSDTVPKKVMEVNSRFYREISCRSRSLHLGSGAGTESGNAGLVEKSQGVLNGASRGGWFGEARKLSNDLGHIVNSSIDVWRETLNDNDDKWSTGITMNLSESGQDTDTMDTRCAWMLWDAGAANSQLNLVGINFRDSPGMMVRVGRNSGSSDVSSSQPSSSISATPRTLDARQGAAVHQVERSVLTPVNFISSALVKVELPLIRWPEPGGVPIDVTGNGGASFSTQTLLYLDDITY